MQDVEAIELEINIRNKRTKRERFFFKLSFVAILRLNPPKVNSDLLGLLVVNDSNDLRNSQADRYSSSL